MNFIVKEHNPESENIILAIIDENLFNKEIAEGKKILDLTADFYKGEKKSKEELIHLINRATHLNVVGTHIVEFLTKKGFIETAMTINKVPYAQITISRS
ncbi:MAG: DUF424 family protein [archaeon]